MNHVSEAIAKAVDEDRVNPPPPPGPLIALEVEGFERAIRTLEKQGKKGDQTALMWMEAMTRRDLYRSGTGKGLDDGTFDVSRAEKTALTQLFVSLNGYEWNKKFGWLGLLKSQTRPEIAPFEASASLFEGVETVKLLATSLVASLRLTGLGARGHLPKHLGDLEAVKSIDLRFNLISGVLPKEMAALENLETLNLSGNQLGGVCDPELFGALTNLKTVDLSSNMFTGPIAHETFAGMTLLRSLDMSDNRFSGPCPRSLSKCTRLETLKLHSNELTGELSPLVFGPLVKLKDVNLSRNRFSGHGLAAFAGCTALERLQLSENDLTGHITPDLVLGLGRLEILYLHNNRMGGHLPPELCTALTKLRRLNLSSNFFRGSLPPDFGNLVNLESLLLIDNEIIGPLPKSFSCLTKLRDFGIIKNHPSEHFRLSRAFKREEFERIFVDGPAMGLNSAVWEHADLYGDAKKDEARFELFERRLYKQRGLPWGLGKI